jgi:NAD(P)-dependent dehydrogenase (short-subunit alcohol dehydrogenase family)
VPLDLPADRPTALVTGAARGIGTEVARQLAQAGHAVVVTARDAERADAVAAALREEGCSAVGARLDLDDAASAAVVAEALGDRPLDVLVANAAAFADWSELPSSADLEQAQAVVGTNLFGTWRVLQALLPAVRRSDAGRIAVVTSGAGSFGEPQFGLPSTPSRAPCRTPCRRRR